LRAERCGDAAGKKIDTEAAREWHSKSQTDAAAKATQSKKKADGASFLAPTALMSKDSPMWHPREDRG
jgi:hypothetical protein